LQGCGFSLASIELQIGLLLLAVTCGFAWFKGGPGERAGATAVAVAWVASLAVQTFAVASLQPVALLLFDLALAASLLIIAIRYASRWLGTAMLLQAFMLAMHAEQLGDDGGMGRITYVVILNAASAAMLLTIVASTVGAWVKRARQQRADSKLDATPGVASPA
jgi:hypothetical protein